MSRSSSDFKLPAIATAAAVTSVALIAASVWWYWTTTSSSSSCEEEKVAAQDEKSGGAAASSSVPRGLRADAASKQQVLEILRKVSGSQEAMRSVMRQATEAVCEKLQQSEGDGSVDFLEIYKHVQGVIPMDPLEAADIPMAEFDQMLDKYNTDEDIRYVLEQIMGLSNARATTTTTAEAAPSQVITKDDVVKIHEFMLQQLQKVVPQVKAVERSNSDKAPLDVRCTTVAAQVIVSAEVMRRFGVTSEAVENAVLEHQFELTVSPDFTRLNMEMQAAMSDLVGNWPVLNGGGK